jgi:hypothetical protein
MKTLFSANFLGTFSNWRQVLNLAIFLNILVDFGGRGGEIAWNRSTPVNTCLLWEDVKVYAFWGGEIEGVDIKANIAFRHLKGMELGPSKYKTVPFSLHTTEMALQDTLRLLLIMAFMDGVFWQCYQFIV